MNITPKRLLQILGICLVGVVVWLLFTYIFGNSSPKTPQTSNPITIKPYIPNSTASQNPGPSLSCPDYESIFGPNYNDQLFIDWTVWSKLNISGSTNNQSVMNYQYNTTAQQSYNLYAESMQAIQCTPSTNPPTFFSPATAPSYDFNPSNSSSKSTCNVPLAYQFLTSYNSQFYIMQQQEQTTLKNWLKNQPASISEVSSALQQGSAAIQSQFYTQAKYLAQQYNTAVGGVGC